MFKVGDFAVCPGHGVGQICEIEEKDVASKVSQFYVLKLNTSGMKVMVPVSSRQGIRHLASKQEIDDIFSLLSDHEEILNDGTNWTCRYRLYMDKIKAGSLLAVADVFRSLAILKNKKGLNFGERKMFAYCKDLLVQEMAQSRGKEVEIIHNEIDACLEASA